MDMFLAPGLAALGLRPRIGSVQGARAFEADGDLLTQSFGVPSQPLGLLAKASQFS
jgi:hypothetical protein